MPLGEIEGLGKGDKIKWAEGLWTFEEDDFLVLAMLMDPVYAAELCFADPGNKAYAGCYRVRDYQYPLFRIEDLYAGAACARSTGKTESIKARAFSHTFRRIMENLLITAPELIHLLPLTDAVEDRIRDTRLTREFLDTRGGQTGFTHKPFGVNYIDGTKIVGRIPRLTGTGVKGQHQPDLIVEEAQDYPEKGWIEVHETVEKDHIDADGDPDFTYHFYGVHSGARDSGFYKRTSEGGFTQVSVTALQRPGWGPAEKQAAKAAYGGSSSPDYRRNILGEAGAAASPMFVTSRLIACVDQDRESKYNQQEYVHQLLRVEEVDELIETMWSEEERRQPGFNPMPDILDLPTRFGTIFGGADLGLTISPTVISIFSHETINKIPRFKLLRKYTLERFRTKQLRQVMYALGWHFGQRLEGFGIDVTGLGFPIFQEMEDDEQAPQYFLSRVRGYFFNAKVPVNVDPEFVSEDASGKLRDQYGAEVQIIEDPYTNEKRYITKMPMISASTRYLRDDFVDSGFMLLPFDPEIVTDMQGETAQRVLKVGEMTGRRKPNAFHILDSFRAMAMVFRSGEMEAELEIKPPAPVLDMAVDLSDPMAGYV